MSVDFTEYLSERLGLAEPATSQLLAAWLRTYEPEAVRLEREAARPSGVPERSAVLETFAQTG